MIIIYKINPDPKSLSNNNHFYPLYHNNNKLIHILDIHILDIFFEIEIEIEIYRIFQYKIHMKIKDKEDKEDYFKDKMMMILIIIINHHNNNNNNH